MTKILLSIFLVILMVVAGHAETRVRIQGMSDKSEKEVLELLGGRLTQVRASPAAPSRADDAAFLLRKMLYNDGYGDAVVTWKVAGPNEIVLIVNEGATAVNVKTHASPPSPTFPNPTALKGLRIRAKPTV